VFVNSRNTDTIPITSDQTASRTELSNFGTLLACYSNEILLQTSRLAQIITRDRSNLHCITTSTVPPSKFCDSLREQGCTHPTVVRINAFHPPRRLINSVDRGIGAYSRWDLEAYHAVNAIIMIFEVIKPVQVSPAAP
jgi:hypothetical protein